jgi:hypothetical protein
LSEDDTSAFSHPIAEVIIGSLVDAQEGEYALDDKGIERIMACATEALETPEAQEMLDTIVDVADFLDEQDGAEASATLMELISEIERIANEEPPAGEYEGFDDDDEIEQTYGRRAAASMLGRKQTSRAPEVGADKPAVGISLQKLIGTKRRI